MDHDTMLLGGRCGVLAGLRRCTKRACAESAARVLLAAALLILGGCANHSPAASASAEVTAAMEGDAARPALGTWLRTELYFAVGRMDAPPGTGIDATAWQGFLDEEVTPRFPDGFTVLDGYGQWRSRDSDRIGRLRTHILLILHPDAADAEQRIEDVRRAFKRRTGQDSVLRSTGPVRVSF